MNPFIRNFAASRHFLLILLLAGCGTPAERQVRQTLRCAEEVLAEHPDSALTLLTPLDTMSLAGEEQAWYAVLRTQAVYKLWRPVTDSLPLLATTYYGTPRRPHYRAAMAWYYQGCAYKEMGKDYDAIASLLTASSLFPDTLSRYASFCQFELGKLYLDHLMLKEATQHFHSYQQSSACQDDSLFAAYADYYLGRTYLYQKQYDKAEANFLSIIHSASVIGKPYRDDAIFQLSKIAYYHHHDNNEALALLNEYIDASAQKDQIGAAYSLKADILRDLGSLDSAYAYYHKSIVCKPDVNTSCWSNKGLADLSGLLGHGDSTAYYISNYTLMLDSVYKKNHQETIDSIRARHQLDFRLQQAEYEKNRLVILLSAAVLTLLLLFLFLYTRADRRRKQEQLRLVQQLRAKEVEIMELNALLPADRSRLLALYRQEAAVCRSLALSQESVRRLSIGRNKAQSLSVQEHDALLAAVRESYVTLFQKVHSDGSFMSEQDRDICALSHLQIPTHDIAEILVVAEETVRTHKHRMKQKLDSDLFQLFFEKA